MSIKLADLFINLAVNGDKLTAELAKSSKKTKAWAKTTERAAKSAKRAFAGVSVAALGSTAALVGIYKANAEALDSLGKTAAKLGDNTAELRTLGLAAEYAGVGAEKMYKNLERMTRRLGDAEDGTGPAADAIERLGLNIDTLIGQRPTEAFESIAGALESIEDPAIRASTAAALFGKDGIAALNLTTGVLEQARSDVEALGGALTNLEIGQIETANDAVFRLSEIVGFAGEKMTAKLAPGVALVAQQLFDTATQGNQLETVMDSLVMSVLQGMRTTSVAVGDVLRYFDGREEIASFGLFGYMLFGKKGALLFGGVGAITEIARTGTEAVKLAFDETASEADRLLAKLANKRAFQKLNGTTSFLDGVIPGFSEANDKLDSQIDGLEQQLRDLGVTNLDTALGLDGTSSTMETLADGVDSVSAGLVQLIQNYGKVPTGGPAAPTSINAPAGISGPPAVGAAGGADAVAANDMTLAAMEAANERYYAREADKYLTFLNGRASDVDAAVRLEIENERVLRNDAYVSEMEAKAALREDYFSQQLAQAQQFEDTWTLFQQSGATDRLAILQNETAGALGTLAQHSKQWFKINKAVGLANAGVSIGVGIAKALELPFPANIAAAATVALKGAAQIVSIKSQKYGQATVASPSGDGGTSGPQYVAPAETRNPTYVEPDVSSPAVRGEGGAAPAIDSVARDTEVVVDRREFLFHSPGASREQRLAEHAAMTAEVESRDFYQRDDTGRAVLGTTRDERSTQSPRYRQIA